MSHPVRVSVKCSQTIEVCNKDEIKVNLGKDPIFSDIRADSIVENAMQAHNFVKNPENNSEYSRKSENTVVVWNIEENSIAIKANIEKAITVEGKKSQTGDSWYSNLEHKKYIKMLEKKAKNELAKDLTEKADAKKLEIADEQKDELISMLEQKLDETLEVSRIIVSEIYKNWVKNRADSLGNITSEKITTSEDGTVFEMTIEITDDF